MKKLILIGGGISVRQGIDQGLWEHIKDCDVWSINYAFMTMPFSPKREVWVDVAFFRNNAEELQQLHAKGVTLVTRIHPVHAGILEFTTQYNSTTQRELFYGREAIKKNMLFRGRMGLSGVFALSLAVAEGYDEIFLLGYDFGNTNIASHDTHYYQNSLSVYSTGVRHPEVYKMPDNSVKREVEDFKVFLIGGLKIWNVSPESNITCFDKITYEQFFEKT